jgi:hypothetical protein
MNEDINFGHLGADYCLACGVRRFSLDEAVSAKAQGPCPEADYPVPGHIKESTGMFCTREGELAPGGRCPDGCDHAPHYANDGHPECEEKQRWRS